MNDTSYKDSIGNFDSIDNYSSLGSTGGLTGITTTNSYISSNTVWANSSNWDSEKEVSEGDIFKQIVSLLGIKIANVKIDGGRVTIYGYRRKKKYIIEISGDSIIITNEKGDQISKILLLSHNYQDGGVITITSPQPYVYPSPGTIQPNTYPIWTTQPYTSSGSYTITGVDMATGTYTIAPESNIIENKVEIDG